MAYPCKRNCSKECDACGYCEPDPEPPVCSVCGVKLDSRERYKRFRGDDNDYCEACLLEVCRDVG